MQRIELNKPYYCHTCMKTSLIDIINLSCPLCGGDFLEEARLHEISFPHEPDSDMSDPDVPIDADLTTESIEYDQVPHVINEDHEENFERIIVPHMILGRNRLFEQRPQEVDMYSNEFDSDLDEDVNYSEPFSNFEDILRHFIRQGHGVFRDGIDRNVKNIIVDENLSYKTCSICLEELVIGTDAKKLACNHAFHQECVDPWLKIRSVCPNCKKSIGGRPFYSE